MTHNYTMTTDISYRPGIDRVTYEGGHGFTYAYSYHDDADLNDGRWLVGGVQGDTYITHLVFDYALACILADDLTCGKVYDVNLGYWGDALPVYVGESNDAHEIVFCDVLQRFIPTGTTYQPYGTGL